MIFLSPTFRQASRVQPQAGFILLPVVIAIVIVASVAFMLNNQSVINSHSLGSESQRQAASYVAEAGFNHALWQTNNSNCSGYPNPLSSGFGVHKYTASVTPTSGSPVSITSKGGLAATPAQPTSATQTITRNNIRIYQPPTTFTMQPDAAEGKDGWVDVSRPNDNFGTTGEMTISGGASPQHFLIEFDSSSIPGTGTILSATLEMHLNWMTSADPAAEFSIYRMTQAWAEGTGDYWNPGDGANWATSDGSASWSWSSNHDASNVIATRQVNPGFSGLHDWNITSLVQQWVSGQQPNYGLLITGNADAVDAYFYSSDRVTQSERPRLTITYACECGVACGGTPPPVVPPGYYDEFNSLTCIAATDYIGSDGTLDWSGFQWQEQDNGNSCTGSVWLLEHQGSNRLAMTSSGGWIERKVDLSTFSGATLTFDYLQIGALDSSRYSSIKFSGDNGSSWTELGRIDTPGDGTTYLSASYVIPQALINANSMLRFENQLLQSGRAVYLDNINIIESAAIPPAANLLLSTSNDAILGGLSFSSGDLAKYDPVIDVATRYFDATLFVGSENIDAVHVLANGHLLLSTITDATLGGLSFTSGDLADYDPVTDVATLYFDGTLFGSSENIDAVHMLANGHLLISTTSDATLGGLSFSSGDLAQYDSATDVATRYFDETLFGGSKNIDAVHVLANGHLLLSTDTDATLGGLSFTSGDLAEYDPVANLSTLYFDETLFGGAENIDSLHVGDGSGIAIGGGGGGGPPPPTDSPVFEEFTEAALGSNGKNLTINKPSGTLAGDLLIVAVITDGQQKPKMKTPAGWTLINHDDESKQITMDVLWKIAGASEPASYNFTWVKSQEAYGWIMRFTGHDPVSPINVSSNAGDSSSSPTSPAVTTTLANTLILRIGGFDDDDITAGDPGLAGHTAITMGDSGNGANTASGGAGYMTQAVAGNSGTADFSLTATEEYRAVTIGIAPAP